VKESVEEDDHFGSHRDARRDDYHIVDVVYLDLGDRVFSPFVPLYEYYDDHLIVQLGARVWIW
jgi:hypothetical protein